MSVVASAHIKLSVRLRSQRILIRMADKIALDDPSLRAVESRSWFGSREQGFAAISPGPTTAQSRRLSRATATSSSR